MPAEMHRELAAQAKKKGLEGKRFNAYVYGTMEKAKKKKKKGLWSRIKEGHRNLKREATQRRVKTHARKGM